MCRSIEGKSFWPGRKALMVSDENQRDRRGDRHVSTGFVVEEDVAGQATFIEVISTFLWKLLLGSHRRAFADYLTQNQSNLETQGWSNALATNIKTSMLIQVDVNKSLHLIAAVVPSGSTLLTLHIQLHLVIFW